MRSHLYILNFITFSSVNLKRTFVHISRSSHDMNGLENTFGFMFLRLLLTLRDFLIVGSIADVQYECTLLLVQSLLLIIYSDSLRGTIDAQS